MNIQEILRAEHVMRWTVVATTRQQSLAEHLFNSAMIAREIVLRMLEPKSDFEARPDDYVPTDVTLVKVIYAALIHDLEEIFTADIPTPAKRRMQRVHPHIMELAGAGYGMSAGSLSEDEKLVIELADKIEAWWFMHEYHANTHAVQVLEDIRANLDISLDPFLPNITTGQRAIIRAARSIREELLKGKRIW